MKLVTFTHHNRTAIGELHGDRVYALSGSDSMRMIDVLRRGITPTRVNQWYPLADVQLNAPVRPGKIIAIGRNYAEHAKETGSDLPPAPIIFAKFPSAVISPGETVTWSQSVTTQVDWEAELAVVIGRRASHVSEEDALDYVFGYTVANDVSARDLQLRIDSQWTRGKSLDTFCPLGPCMVTRNEIPDPQNLHIWTKVNDQMVQDSNTQHMIFNVVHLISYCSRMFTLEPGDLILTGTPSGVGEGMKPPQYLKDGDVMTVAVDGIGELTNPCRVTE
jgi:2-keto-4-pentenoate hydratase/2-oxohepta-3-ene-1,7-dioic acid hydratase in catechol pathway